MPFAPGEPLHHHFQAPSRSHANAGDAPRQVARAVPSLQRETRAPQFEREVAIAERQQFLTRLKQRRLPSAFEKRSMAARASSPQRPAARRSGGIGNRIIARGAATIAVSQAVRPAEPRVISAFSCSSIQFLES